ncbi:MAG: competence protein ComEA [Solirubrobacteraceae bacterium]|nr:competence protein ComEA [Solirubrobacteraceae bacterium]
MPDLPRSHLIAYALAGLLVLALGARAVAHSRTAQAPAARVPIALPADTAPAADGAAAAGDRAGAIVVDVAGEVRRPGVYRMPAGARVDDAVRRAGGARRRADLSQINLAAKLEDGKQVLVPARAPAAPAGASTAGTAAAAPGVPLNLNTATLEQLDTLPGVGPATAQKILDYREQHSGFSSVEELGQVPGIGDIRLASLREAVRV